MLLLCLGAAQVRKTNLHRGAASNPKPHVVDGQDEEDILTTTTGADGGSETEVTEGRGCCGARDDAGEDNRARLTTKSNSAILGRAAV